MELLALPRRVVKLLGLWVPSDTLSNSIADWIYRIYGNVVFALMITVLFLLAVALLYARSIAEFTEILFTSLSIFASLVKMLNFRWGQADFEELFAQIEGGDFAPRNDREREVVLRNDASVRSLTWFFIIYANITSALFFGGSILVAGIGNRPELPLKIWLPFGGTDSLGLVSFWILYLSLFCASLVGSNVTISSDVLFYGSFMSVPVQFAILEFRLEDIVVNEDPGYYRKSALGIWLRHHDEVYKYAAKCKETYSVVAGVQFCITAIIVSCSIYELSVNPFDPVQAITILVYVTAIFLQLFVYCYAGDEVKFSCERFFRSIYNVDWMRLDVPGRKIILQAMTRASKPIIVDSGKLIVFSLDSFKMMLKLCYTAFNMLRTSMAANQEQ